MRCHVPESKEQPGYVGPHSNQPGSDAGPSVEIYGRVEREADTARKSSVSRPGQAPDEAGGGRGTSVGTSGSTARIPRYCAESHAYKCVKFVYQKSKWERRPWVKVAELLQSSPTLTVAGVLKQNPQGPIRARLVGAGQVEPQRRIGGAINGWTKVRAPVVGQCH